MDENANTTDFNANSETIEETGSESKAPSNEDYANGSAVDDPTSDNAGNDGGENENYLANFKTKEDAEKGFKATQAKITEQGNKIKELEAKINGSNNSMPDVNTEVANARNKVLAEYNNRLRGLGVKYSSFVPNDVQINTIEDIIANLPPLDAGRFVQELNSIQIECNGKLQNEINTIQQNASTKFEEIKAQHKEQYKNNQLVFEAWYNPPETIEGVAELIEKVRKSAIEDYIKQQAASKEDQTHKNKLSTTANTSTKKYNDGHIFTRSEIDKMGMEEFAKYENEISRQVAAGLVK